MNKYAHWDYIATHDCFSCSSCKYDSDVVLDTCPKCGAIMNDEEKERQYRLEQRFK